MSKKTIYIIRHGQTDYNKQGIVQGSGVDSSLNKTGRAQGQAFFEHYQHIHFEAVLTSTLKRTKETVQSFIDLGLPWEQFSDINEICWGDQEGQKPSLEARKKYMYVVNEWNNGRFSARLNNAENALELADRLERFVQHLKTRTEQNILICSHGRAMRALMCILTDSDLTEMDTFRHSNTGLYQFSLENGQFELLLKNDKTHRDVAGI